MKSLIKVSPHILEDFLRNISSWYCNSILELKLIRPVGWVEFVFNIFPQENIICMRPEERAVQFAGPPLPSEKFGPSASNKSRTARFQCIGALSPREALFYGNYRSIAKK